jgi:hypothetical protein
MLGRNFQIAAAKTMATCAGALAVVVVLAAMPGHRQRTTLDAQKSQSTASGQSVATAGVSHRHPDPAGHNSNSGMDDHKMAGMDPDGQQHAAAAIESMTPGHHHDLLHMKMTAMRASSPSDEQRAARVVDTLRTSIEKYRDYHVALEDGYQPFLPNLPQKEYHFTNKWNAFRGAFSFDAARPTSLLYKKTSDGYELRGAMFTMPKDATEDQLDSRVPLSVARWHLHTNLCMPPKGEEKSSDWSKFGLAGSIATPESCSEAGGRFFPSIFGWMVHIYPYEDTKEKIYAHM